MHTCVPFPGLSEFKPGHDLRTAGSSRVAFLDHEKRFSVVVFASFVVVSTTPSSVGKPCFVRLITVSTYHCIFLHTYLC